MEKTQINNINLLDNKDNLLRNINKIREVNHLEAQNFNNNLLDNKKIDKNNKKIIILLFYKFQEIKNLEYFARRHRRFCKKLGVLGKVLIAREGINGSISGTKEQVEKYKEFIWLQKGFEDVKFKEEAGIEHPFTKIVVRIRKEIVSLKKKIDINKRGEYLTPKEFLELYNNFWNISKNVNNKIINDDNERSKNRVRGANQGRKIKKFNNKIHGDIIILDARNYYEYELGRFKNAINPKIKIFRDFPKFVERFKKKFNEKEREDKKIVMYCTGGIRCEKASAYMIKQGFKNVYQLEGGVINFCQQFPDTIWEGKCFVFDKRLMTDINQNNKPITKCIHCMKLCDLYRNCKNLRCDKLVIMCVKCQEKLQGCCSENCLKGFLEYSRGRAFLKKLRKWEAKEVLQSYVK
ncbi:MAG: tRNA uridine(34) hydroxylase [Nanoarchaeota archaeon]